MFKHNKIRFDIRFLGINNQNIKKYVIMLAVFGLFAWNFTYLIQSPNQNDLGLILKRKVLEELF